MGRGEGRCNEGGWEMRQTKRKSREKREKGMEQGERKKTQKRIGKYAGSGSRSTMKGDWR